MTLMQEVGFVVTVVALAVTIVFTILTRQEARRAAEWNKIDEAWARLEAQWKRLGGFAVEIKHEYEKLSVQRKRLAADWGALDTARCRLSSDETGKWS